MAVSGSRAGGSGSLALVGLSDGRRHLIERVVGRAFESSY